MLTTSTFTTTVSDLRVQAQNSTPLQANQSAHKCKTVATALHRDVTLYCDRNAQMVAGS
jgi:hypothetical protein